MGLQVSDSVHPKRRKQKFFGALRVQFGEMFHELVSHEESKIVEVHLMEYRVHMCLVFRPKNNFTWNCVAL
ncbi:transposase [Burkholderia ubonensis]|uniref:transposase n=1 Tax=Burkholderia ubonensis TaxID=101571 RepID=UPI000A4CDFD8